LLDLIFDRVPGLDVLLVVAFRPEFEHGWSGQPHVSMLTMNRLGEGDGVALVERLAGNAGLSHEIVEEIMAAPLADDPFAPDRFKEDSVVRHR
jgi:predicted ATPase